MLATVWKEIEVRIWDAKAYHLLGELNGHRGFISSLDFSNDNSILATGGGDHRVMIWDTNRFTLISEKEFEYPVSATVFCRENVVAALVGLSLVVVVVDIRTGATVKHWQFAMPINNVLSASTYDDDVICAATSGFILCSNATVERMAMNIRNGIYVNCACVDGSGLLLASSHESTKLSVMIWRLNREQPVHILEAAHCQEVTCLCFSRESHQLVSGSADYSVKTWLLQQARINGIAVSPGRTIACENIVR
jgi:hypothetical protein